MLILIVVLFGVISFWGLGLDLMPELEFPIVSITTRYEGVAAEDIEKLITRQIEKTVYTLKGVKSVYSVSQEGLSNVVVEFAWGTNIDFAAQDVRDSLGIIETFLPSDAEKPVVMKTDVSQMPVVFYGVTGMDDTIRLRKILEDEVSPRLERQEGVAAAMVLGGKEREISVKVQKARLESYGIPISQVTSAIAMQNKNVSAGHVERGYEEFLIRTVGEYSSVAEIAETIVAISGTVPVRLKEIATVEDTCKEIRQYTKLNGQDAVLLMVTKQSGTNTVLVANRIARELEVIKSEVPSAKELQFSPVFDQAYIIKRIVNYAAVNVLEGAILVIILVYLFLGNWRPTLVIFLAIPLSVLATFIGMSLLDYTFNMFTLAGLALGVGMLVDNAVVVTENTFRHMLAGVERKTAAALGAEEVGAAITSSTITTMVVFLPMVLVSGLAGKLSRPLALTVCLSLLASLLVAVTLVPTMASGIFFKKGKLAEGVWFRRVKEKYKSLLRGALRKRRLVLTIVAGVFILSLLSLLLLPTEFMPKQDIPMAMLKVEMPVGTNLEQTNRVVQAIEDYAQSFKSDVRMVLGIVGPGTITSFQAASSTGIADVNQSLILIRLYDKTERKLSLEEFQDAIRKRCPDIEGATFNFQSVGIEAHAGGADEAPIAIRIFGSDIDTLTELARGVMERIKDVEGLKDIHMSMKEGKPELKVTVDTRKAAQVGLTTAQIETTLETASLGKVASYLRERGEETDIRVRLREEDRDSIEKIRNITVASPVGESVPLSQVTDLTVSKGPIQIARERQSRKVTVWANTYQRAPGTTVEEIKTRLADYVRSFPPGYSIDYGGTYKDMQDTFRDLLYALTVSILLVYMVMAAQFESLSQPFIVMFTVPLGMIGIAIGMHIMHLTISAPSFMSVIILGGIVVNNAIVMIDYVNRLIKRGMDRHEAVIEGAATRLRPILITSLTTVLGVLPMGFASGEGSELKSPLGITLGFGLLFATFSTLFVIPAIYTIVGRIRTDSPPPSPDNQ
jgi:HAE1 family hydrophobic/amphiphilic exporter-1